MYNFSLCKEVKDNHLNVVLRDNTTDAILDSACFHVNSSRPPAAHPIVHMT